MNFQGKRLLLLGGSRISCEIVKHARRMGIITGVTDWYPLEKSPAKQVADEAYFVSTSDVEAIATLISDQKFDGIITGFTDSVLPYYAEIGKKTNLPVYGTREQFEMFINKKNYKELMHKFDVPTIPEYSVDPNNIDETAKDLKYPVLVKPADSSGSRGISVCWSVEELKVALQTADSFSETGVAVVEQYLDTPEVTIFWIFVDGQYYMMLLGNRHVKHHEGAVLPLPVGYTFPAAVQTAFLKDTAKKMENMFRHVGIMNGMMFMQAKLDGDVCRVYDIGYRLTGSLEYNILKSGCGYDPLDMLISYALTGNMGEPEIESKVDPYLRGKYAYNVSVLAKPGKIAEIRGIDEVMSIPGVIDVVVSHPAGEIITDKMCGLLAQITIRVLGMADSIVDMKKKVYEIQSMIEIISDTGENLCLSGMEETDFSCLT